MLSQLYIKNIAVISEAVIDFGPKFNVFTGETGAGKTILVSAINGPFHPTAPAYSTNNRRDGV